MVFVLVFVSFARPGVIITCELVPLLLKEMLYSTTFLSVHFCSAVLDKKLNLRLILEYLNYDRIKSH